MSRRRTTWAIPAVLAIFAGGQAAGTQEAPCRDAPGRRQLDYLIGEWRLVGLDGAQVADVVVEERENGCMIAETWLFADGRTASSYSSYDPAASLWRRYGVSGRGVVVRSAGTIANAALDARGERVDADGLVVGWREEMIRVADDERRIVYRAWSSRREDGAEPNWELRFEGYLVSPAASTEAPTRRAAELPEPPARETFATNEPAPEPSPRPVAIVASAPAAGEVTPASARAADAAVIERIAMASPMVLKLPMGAVESLPPGYAWITRDTAPYLCEGITIERLQVEREERRGQVELAVEFAVQSTRQSRPVNIHVALQWPGEDGDVAQTGEVAGRVGRNIPEQIEHGTIALTARLELEATLFRRLVGGAERPELVITLSVGR